MEHPKQLSFSPVALYWSTKNGNYDRVQQLLAINNYDKEEIFEYCSPRPRGYKNPAFKHKSVRWKENDETRLFDYIDDIDGVMKGVSSHSKLQLYTIRNTLEELFEFEAFITEMSFVETEKRKLSDIQEEFCNAMSWYLSRIDTKNAEMISLHSATILANAPLTLEGIQKCASELADSLHEIRNIIVRKTLEMLL